MNEAKQMGDGALLLVQLHTRLVDLSIAVRVGGKRVSSRSYSYLNEAAPSFFMGALGVLEPDDGKLSAEATRLQNSQQRCFNMPAANPPRHVTCDDSRSNDKEYCRANNGEYSPHCGILRVLGESSENLTLSLVFPPGGLNLRVASHPTAMFNVARDSSG